jgi:lactoylglutathione lyase
MLKILVIALLASTSSAILASNPPQSILSIADIYPFVTVGTDPPADIATRGYTINHVALLVRNLTETQHFYGDVLGMRHLITLNVSASYTVMIMAHSQGGKNGTGFQTGQELLSERTNCQGLMEFLSPMTESKSHHYIPSRTTTFSHIGMIVPDILAAQERMEAFNVTILKRVGELPAPGSILFPVYGFLDMSLQGVKNALEAMAILEFDGLLYVQDPDGNVIEILPM